MACSSRSMRNALRDLIGLAQDIAEAAIRRVRAIKPFRSISPF